VFTLKVINIDGNTKGIPQGSILGPILFSIFINDLDKDVKAKLHLYADDTVVYTQASTI